MDNLRVRCDQVRWYPLASHGVGQDGLRYQCRAGKQGSVSPQRGRCFEAPSPSSQPSTYASHLERYYFFPFLSPIFRPGGGSALFRSIIFDVVDIGCSWHQPTQIGQPIVLSSVNLAGGVFAPPAATICRIRVISSSVISPPRAHKASAWAR
jgi:hypothetical protein